MSLHQCKQSENMGNSKMISKNMFSLAACFGNFDFTNQKENVPLTMTKKPLKMKSFKVSSHGPVPEQKLRSGGGQVQETAREWRTGTGPTSKKLK